MGKNKLQAELGVSKERSDDLYLKNIMEEFLLLNN